MLEKIKWIFIYFLFFVVNGGITKYIYVSQTSTSNDIISCGSIQYPCRSLNFAISYISHSFDTIYLDGGPLQGPVFVYQIYEVINVTKNITLTKAPSLSHAPVITGNASSPIIHVFDIDYNGVLYLNVSYITFEGVSIVSIRGQTTAAINFHECKGLNSKKSHVYISTDKSENNTSVNVHLSNCKFYHNYAVIQTMNINYLKLTINDCTVEGNNEFTPQLGLLITTRAEDTVNITVANSTFFKLHSAVSVGGSFTCTNNKQKIYFDRCNFYNNFPRCILQKCPPGFVYYGSTIKIEGCLDLVISNSNFSGNIAKSGGAVALYDIRSARLQNCLFTNNTSTSYGGACYLRNTTQHITIQNCTFLNNTAGGPYNFLTGNVIEIDHRNGGAIASFSDVFVIKSTFHGNRASTFGGSIYHKSTSHSVHVPHKGTIEYKTHTHLTLYKSSITGAADKNSLFGELIYAEADINLEDVHLQAIMFSNKNSYIYHAEESVLQIKGTFQFDCPVNHQLLSENNKISLIEPRFGLFLLYCYTCKKDSFSLDHESYSKKAYSDILAHSKIKCMTCPTGGKCDTTIVSKDNFWGSTYNNSVTFTVCPYKYCCTDYGEKCKTFITCARNRNGILCGSCSQGFSENLITSECVPHEGCYSRSFWFVYFVAALFYVIIILYLKELVSIFKRCLKRFKVTSTNSLQVRLISETNINNHDQIENETNEVDSQIRLLTETNKDQNQTENQTIANDLQVNLLTETNRNSGELESPTSANSPTLKEFTFISNSSETTSYIQTQSRVSGIIKILFFFYQMEFLMKVSASARNTYDFHNSFIKDIFRSLFNLQMSSDESSFKVCPYQGMDAIGKEIIKVCFTLILFLIVFLLMVSSYVNKLVSGFTKDSNSNTETVFVINENIPVLYKVPFDIRLKACTVQLLLLTYASIATFAFKMINCVRINGSEHLYVNATYSCWKWWQYLVIGFIVVWVIPFPLGLYLGNRMLRYCKISVNEYVFGLFLPLWLIICFLYKKSTSRTLTDAIYAKHVLSMTDDGFRHKSNGVGNVMWEGMLIFRRLILIMLLIFIINPIIRLYVVLVPLFIFLLDHVRVRPYKDKLLNWLGIISLVFLCFLCIINLFWAYLYISDVILTPSLKFTGYVFLLVELSILLLPFIVIVLSLIFSLGKFIVKLYKGSINKQD